MTLRATVNGLRIEADSASEMLSLLREIGARDTSVVEPRPSTEPEPKTFVDNVYALLKQRGRPISVTTLHTIAVAWTAQPVDAVEALTRDRPDLFIRRSGRMFGLREWSPEVQPRIFTAPDTRTIRSHASLIMRGIRGRRATVRTLVQAFVDRKLFESDSRYAYERIWKTLDDCPDLFQRVAKAEYQLIDSDQPCTLPAHDWQIETPSGPTSLGRCRNCRTVREFANSDEIALQMTGTGRGFNGRKKER